MKHYNYNPDEKPMAHLTSLPRYLQDTASDAIFNEIRYWEFDQDTDSAILQTIILWIHMELLHALSEILLEAQRSKETVKHRVDRAVQEAMHPSNQLTYSPGSRRESLVRRYLDWRNSHESPTHALKHAAESQFEVGRRLLFVHSQNRPPITVASLRPRRQILRQVPQCATETADRHSCRSPLARIWRYTPGRSNFTKRHLPRIHLQKLGRTLVHSPHALRPTGPVGKSGQQDRCHSISQHSTIQASSGDR